jgi:hypothetical protein
VLRKIWQISNELKIGSLSQRSRDIAGISIGEISEGGNIESVTSGWGSQIIATSILLADCSLLKGIFAVPIG